MHILISLSYLLISLTEHRSHWSTLCTWRSYGQTRNDNIYRRSVISLTKGLVRFTSTISTWKQSWPRTQQQGREISFAYLTSPQKMKDQLHRTPLLSPSCLINNSSFILQGFICRCCGCLTWCNEWGKWRMSLSFLGLWNVRESRFQLQISARLDIYP